MGIGYEAMDTNAKTEFLAKTAEECVAQVSAMSLSPESAKVPRTFGITDVAKWVRKTTTAVRLLETDEYKVIKPPRRDDKNSRQYTMAEVEAIRRYWKLVPERAPGTRAPVLLIGNHKGGVAKSQTAVHLAVFCARNSMKVLLVDMDAQATLTSFFYTLPNETFVLDDTAGIKFKNPDASLEEVVRPTHWHGLDIIPSCLQLGEIDTGQHREAQAGRYARHDPMSPHRRLVYGLDSLRDKYDLVIIDSSPSLTLTVIACMTAATSIVVPLMPAIPDFSSTREFFHTLYTLVREEKQQLDFLKMLFTRVENHPSAQDVMAFLRERFGESIMQAHVGNSSEIRSAANIMQTVYDLESAIGTKRTYDRAVEMLDNVNLEIVAGVLPQWVPVLTHEGG